jgi:DNA mismatch repair protein MutL
MDQARPIRLLPPDLRNRINAGEVVDRPAGVIKELVENSLDAGAERIEAAIERGGLARITIQDDGSGVPADQLELAVTRHATSKISSDEDLFNVATLGFRGEALPSVAAVSKLSFSSRTRQDADTGWRIVSNFGEIEEAGPAAMNPGTRAEVSDLFANVPARLKFLKTEAAEARRSREAVFRLALAHPETAFLWAVDGKTQFDLPQGQSLQERLSLFWPEAVCEGLIPVEHEQAGVRVAGLAGSPNTAQARADRILLYVRGRPVSDKLLMGAVKNAYKGRLISREQPQAVIFVDLPPAEVDVNVHPAKLEVRFRREDAVFSAVRTAIVRALDKASTLRPPEGASDEAFVLAPTRPAPPSPYQQLLDVRPDPRRADPTSQTPAADLPDAPPTGPGSSSFDAGPPSLGATPSDASFSAEPQAFDAEQPYWERDPAVPAAVRDDARTYNGNVLLSHGLNYLGQIANAYLALVETSGELLLVDQHAAHERILFEARRRAAASALARPLAMPLSMSLHPSEAERLQSLWSAFRSLGFDLEIQNAGVLVRACPGELDAGQALNYLRSALDGQADSLEELWVLMSCRAAVKAGDRLSRGEALSLLETWLQTDNREHCPHGRPVVVRLGERELAKMFKRTG